MAQINFTKFLHPIPLQLLLTIATTDLPKKNFTLLVRMPLFTMLKWDSWGILILLKNENPFQYKFSQNLILSTH